MQTGSFIRCAGCVNEERFQERLSGPWWRLNFDGPAPAPSILIRDEPQQPPFFCCSLECLRRLVNSDKFKDAARQRESA